MRRNVLREDKAFTLEANSALLRCTLRFLCHHMRASARLSACASARASACASIWLIDISGPVSCPPNVKELTAVRVRFNNPCFFKQTNKSTD